MINFSQVTYRYSGQIQPAVSNLNLQLLLSQATALSGANGCGKTTVSRLAMQLLQPDSGTVSYGPLYAAKPQLWQISRQIGYLMQNPRRQLFSGSVYEEMVLPFRLQDQLDSNVEEQARVRLEQFDLWTLRSRDPITLSSGEQKRLALAALLMQNPSYLILDEPGSALDTANRTLLADFLRQWQSAGRGFLLISHDQVLRQQCCDRFLLMRQGSIREVHHAL